MYSMTGSRIASLERHLGFLGELQNSHQVWASDKEIDAEIQSLHTEIIVILKDAGEKYSALLALYHKATK